MLPFVGTCGNLLRRFLAAPILRGRCARPRSCRCVGWIATAVRARPLRRFLVGLVVTKIGVQLALYFYASPSALEVRTDVPRSSPHWTSSAFQFKIFCCVLSRCSLRRAGPERAQPAVVHHHARASPSAPRLPDLDVVEVRPMVGRIVVRRSGPRRGLGRRSARGCRGCRASATSRARRTWRRISTRSRRRSPQPCARPDGARSFRITARRADKRFPIPSPDIERAVGARVQAGDRLARRSLESRSSSSASRC